jgi:hypothetical protein
MTGNRAQGIFVMQVDLAGTVACRKAQRQNDVAELIENLHPSL